MQQGMERERAFLQGVRAARGPIAVLAASVALVALASAAPRAPGGSTGAPRDVGSLTGKLLVAAPEMNDRFFTRAVVYMLHHDAGGAMGLIVNRPYKEIPIAQLMEHLGLDAKGVSGSIRMHFGGPVEPGQALLLHTTDYKIEGTQVIADGFALTGRPEILRAIGAGAGPRRFFLALGYAGWAPGQLEREIALGSWLTVPADPDLVFGQDDDKKWDKALARHKIDL